MKITKEKLEEMGACEDGLNWFKETFPRGISPKTAARAAIKQGNFNFANWFLLRELSQNDKIRYAVYAAELVLYIFEKKYPNDDRPRKAIDAAKKYLELGTSAYAADAADAAADAAAYAAYAAADAAYAAAYAAYAAAYAAYAADYAAAYAAYAADYAAADADYAAADAAYAADYAAADAEIKAKIINYGVGLLEKIGGNQ